MMSGKWNWLRKLLRLRPQPLAMPIPAVGVPMELTRNALERMTFVSPVRLDAQGFPIAYFQDNGFNGDVVYQRKLAAHMHLPGCLTRQ